jgi:hypothetical protein
MIFAYKVYRPLRDSPESFKNVRLSNNGAALAWGGDDNAIDMAATTVERLAEEVMSSTDFRAWLERLGLTYEAASAQLGISRRLVAYYAGKRHLPRYIALACRYLESQLLPKSTRSDLLEAVREKRASAAGLLGALGRRVEEGRFDEVAHFFSGLSGQAGEVRTVDAADILTLLMESQEARRQLMAATFAHVLGDLDIQAQSEEWRRATNELWRRLQPPSD